MELDYEWDIDRTLMANFSIVGGMAYAAGIRGNRGWQAFFATQLGFLLLHAIKGWCPPAVLFRRLGFRSRQEIEAEKTVLRQLLSETLDTSRKSRPA